MDVAPKHAGPCRDGRQGHTCCECLETWGCRDVQVCFHEVIEVVGEQVQDYMGGEFREFSIGPSGVKAGLPRAILHCSLVGCCLPRQFQQCREFVIEIDLAFSDGDRLVLGEAGGFGSHGVGGLAVGAFVHIADGQCDGFPGAGIEGPVITDDLLEGHIGLQDNG